MPKKSLIAVESSDDVNRQHYRFVFHGPPKVGKTFLALTASEHFPDELPADPSVSLDDMMWWSFDAGALRGVEEQGIKVPHVLNFAPISGSDIFPAVREAATKTAELVEKGLTKWVVCDTISTLDSKMKTHWRAKTADKGKFALYDAMLASHNKFFDIINSLPCHVIVLSHSKANVYEDEKSKNKQKAQAMSSQKTPDVELDIAGAGKNEYRRHSDMVAPLLQERDKRGQWSRNIYPFGHKGWEGGTRWTRELEKVEPAHLGKLMAKIQKGAE